MGSLDASARAIRLTGSSSVSATLAQKYVGTRHNVGEDAIKVLAERTGSHSKAAATTHCSPKHVFAGPTATNASSSRFPSPT